MSPGRWFGFQHAGVRPDIVTMAKAMGNGFPVGATWARTDVAAAFRPGDHGSTYSGTAIARPASTNTGNRNENTSTPVGSAAVGFRCTWVAAMPV